jgi:hypothetical protein
MAEQFFRSIPAELLVEIAGHLSSKDLLAFSHVDKRTFGIVSNSGSLWRRHVSALPSHR